MLTEMAMSSDVQIAESTGHSILDQKSPRNSIEEVEVHIIRKRDSV